MLLPPNLDSLNPISSQPNLNLEINHNLPSNNSSQMHLEIKITMLTKTVEIITEVKVEELVVTRSDSE